MSRAEQLVPGVRGRTLSYRRRWWILLVLTLSVFIVVLDDMVIVVALPAIQADLGASASQLQWILDSYLLVFAGLLLPAGSLGDRFGRRRALLVGLLTFGSGSLTSAYAPTVESLIISRAVMGVGAACIMPTTLSILTNIFPPTERVRAIAIWSGVVGVGVGIGPAAGGFATEQFWWGAAFLVNVPVVAATVGLALWLVVESREEDSDPLDIVGALLSIAGLGVLLYAIIDAPARGWTSQATLAAAAGGLLLLTAFGLWERQTARPLLDIRFFRNARFTVAVIALMLTFFSLLGLLFVSTQLFQAYHGHSPLQAGLRIAPVAGAIIGGAALSPGFARLAGAKVVVFAGLLLVALGIATVALTGDAGYPGVLAGITAVGVGMGVAMTPATDAIMGSLPPSRAGVGSAINDTTRQVGAALGVAVIGSILSHQYSSRLVAASDRPAWAELGSLGASISASAQMEPPEAAALVWAGRLAFAEAMQASLLVAAGAALGAAFLVLAWLPAHERRTGEEIRDEFLQGTLPRGVRLRDWLLRPMPPRNDPDDAQ